MPPRPSRSNTGASFRPPSPALSNATTSASRLDFGDPPRVVITRADLRSSLAAYETLMAASKVYRQTLFSLSTAAATLASALEDCARQKGADGSGPGLQAVAGMHWLLGNLSGVLGDTVYKSFEIPLLQNLDAYRAAVAERQATYESSLTLLSTRIKKTESENLRTGKRGQRDLQSFRAALAALQAQVDELDELKSQYYHEVYEAEEELWEGILGKLGLVLRCEVDTFDRFVSKTTDPILEPVLAHIEDPFQAFGPEKDDNAIFSVLPPLGIPIPQTLSRTQSPPQPQAQQAGEAVATSPKKERLKKVLSVVMDEEEAAGAAAGGEGGEAEGERRDGFLDTPVLERGAQLSVPPLVPAPAPAPDADGPQPPSSPATLTPSSSSSSSHTIAPSSYSYTIAPSAHAQDPSTSSHTIAPSAHVQDPSSSSHPQDPSSSSSAPSSEPAPAPAPESAPEPESAPTTFLPHLHFLEPEPHADLAPTPEPASDAEPDPFADPAPSEGSHSRAPTSITAEDTDARGDEVEVEAPGKGRSGVEGAKERAEDVEVQKENGEEGQRDEGGEDEGEEASKPRTAGGSEKVEEGWN